jgi:hypothetical protein
MRRSVVTVLQRDSLPLDELANGLPLFGVLLHVPQLDAKMQVFRLVDSVVLPGFTLYTLLVHPEELGGLPELADADAFCQLHGEVWVLRQVQPGLTGPGKVTVGRLSHGPEYTVQRVGDDEVAARHESGRTLVTEPAQLLGSDDRAVARLLAGCFLDAYADEALSVPLVRGYPGTTSLIDRYREIPVVLPGEPRPRTAPARWLWEPVTGAPGDRRTP